MKKCKLCGSAMVADTSQVYTSIPPQYLYTCTNTKCGNKEFGLCSESIDMEHLTNGVNVDKQYEFTYEKMCDGVKSLEKELMIGDWVMYNPNVFIEDEYEPAKEWFPIRINSGEDIDLAIEGCYAPIPLTTDILEKNGFVLESDGWVFYNEAENKEQNYICVSFRHNGETRRVEINYVNKALCVFRTIFYVHEMQHALKLCGIKKEIEI